MDIAFLLYDNMTSLDFIGPYQVLGLLPKVRLHLAAVEAGPIRTDLGVKLHADKRLEEVTRADIVVVPGSPDPSKTMADPRVQAWLRALDATSTWTTSVCTGSLILGAAGLLQGKRATTHWIAMDALRTFGATPVAERVVFDGKTVSAAGVSAGIDMALALAGKAVGPMVAQCIQLGIEYDPEPPYNAGSLKVAPPEVIEASRAMLSSVMPG
ncbi:DJ-1/PfpI family protein [Pyxidicoccus xibeiensis]|uniref:DJ-1/PfpI family protein n=1 Tax=Pyxidicoccus xibeiensis TaxID=2906759 RepID=UPI0020A7868B|nr:DJ-1/PfpI family protein [Pyxidicoccus xibeiensis]MCP3140957.1 DJ-1/PfpI family protein [Pyxidicoccus xibeiensis]